MAIDRTVENENTETFIYKCTNPNCEDYGYKETTK